MEIILGFLIAVAIGVTGVGAGIITAPVLILFFHVPPVFAVGTALAFGVAVKLLVVPMQLARKQVDFRVLGYMLAGGIPGVIIGALNLYRVFLRPNHKPTRDYSRWLPLITLPIGAEVGFSSAGAGALGSLALLIITPLTAAQVVGTDLFFGLCVSLVGSGFQLTAGNYAGAILTKLIIGGAAGAFVGTYLAAIAPQRALRVALSLWLISLGIQLCWSGLHHS